MNDKSEHISKALVLMFNLFKEKPSKEVMAVYINCLKPYELKDIKSAISIAVNSSEYCPRPATILKHLRPSKDDLKAKAINEATRVIESIRRGDSKCLTGDPLTAYLMNSRWRLHILQDNLLESEVKWFQKEFIDTYISYSKSPAMLDVIEEGNALKPSGAYKLDQSLANKLKPNIKNLDSKPKPEHHIRLSK